MLDLVTLILTVLVALLHFWFMCLEMFLWQKKLGLKAFGNTLEYAQSTAVLAANQGLYNGFLAGGLLASCVFPDLLVALAFRVYFLVCVVVAGVYGAWSLRARLHHGRRLVSRKILLVQALPAACALVLTLV